MDNDEIKGGAAAYAAISGIIVFIAIIYLVGMWLGQ